MVGLLNKSGGLKKVVRAIEKQPKLLFLVRLAPYPYNLMNTLLASSPTLTMRTYVTCTALALPKLLIHTGLGTSIKNFAAYNGAAEGVSKEEAEASQTAEKVKKWAGLVGIGLCVGIMIYLLSVARKAVDELDDEDDEGYEDVLFDEDGEELLSSDYDEDEEDVSGGVGVDGRDHGSGVDMRERAGPSTWASATAMHQSPLRPKNDSVRACAILKPHRDPLSFLARPTNVHPDQAPLTAESPSAAADPLEITRSI